MVNQAKGSSGAEDSSLLPDRKQQRLSVRKQQILSRYRQRRDLPLAEERSKPAQAAAGLLVESSRSSVAKQQQRLSAIPAQFGRPEEAAKTPQQVPQQHRRTDSANPPQHFQQQSDIRNRQQQILLSRFQQQLHIRNRRQQILLNWHRQQQRLFS